MANSRWTRLSHRITSNEVLVRLPAPQRSSGSTNRSTSSGSGGDEVTPAKVKGRVNTRPLKKAKEMALPLARGAR
jgi:hypothetical protein